MPRRIPACAAIAILSTALVLSVTFAVTFGTVDIAPADVYRVVLGKLTAAQGEYSSGRIHDVVWVIRLPRLILATGVGMALSVSGLVMQALVRNPIAEPYVLGISSGAYAGAAVAILLGAGAALGSLATGAMAFIGALLACAAVLAVAGIGGSPNAVRLILAGTAVGAMCSAFSNFIIYFSVERDRVQALLNWTMGSLGGATWQGDALMLTAALVGSAFFLSAYRTLNLMLLGDDAATTLGVNTRQRRLLYLPVCALMIGLSVNAAGMIAFVGLVVPHVMRLLFGPDHKKLVPLCALSGAILLVWADVLCRTAISGAELPIGIITALIGTPCFIWLIARKKYQFGGEG